MQVGGGGRTEPCRALGASRALCLAGGAQAGLLAQDGSALGCPSVSPGQSLSVKQKRFSHRSSAVTCDPERQNLVPVQASRGWLRLAGRP